eukprot:253686_1
MASEGVLGIRDLFANLTHKLTDSSRSLTTTRNRGDSDHLPPKSPSLASSASSPSDSASDPLQYRSKWRPSLKLICNDTQLVDALTGFMRKRYNEESILFLQAVTKLTNDINNVLLFSSTVSDPDHTNINNQINDIYSLFIVSGADKQINLSSDCFHNIMSKAETYTEYTMLKKKSLFTMCFAEISHLVSNSTVQYFYHTPEFQSIAKSRRLLDNKYVIHKPFTSESTDDDTDDERETKNDTEVNNVSFFNTQCNQYMLSSKCLRGGKHTWSIKIEEYEGDRMEFGVVSNHFEAADIRKFGVRGAYSFGSRATYGYRTENDAQRFFYASYNTDNTTRCHKDLSSCDVDHEPFKKGDVIKICLNLKKGNVKFYRNNDKVRKTISLEKNSYYPIIAYSGEQCKIKMIE